jgi:hypothetical protein
MIAITLLVVVVAFIFWKKCCLWIRPCDPGCVAILHVLPLAPPPLISTNENHLFLCYFCLFLSSFCYIKQVFLETPQTMGEISDNDLDQFLIFTPTRHSQPKSSLSASMCLSFLTHFNYTTWSLNPSLAWHLNNF